MLAGFFFPETSEQLQFEGFVSAADSIEEDQYSLDDILEVVRKRMGSNSKDPAEQIHGATGQTILRKSYPAKQKCRGLMLLVKQSLLERELSNLISR